MAQIVTITNPLTGQPAKVDQLDHTAQQIDDGIGFESTDYPGCYYRLVNGVVEWFNPPMLHGEEEYRTTERFLNKPVYAKAVDLSVWPGDGVITSLGIDGVSFFTEAFLTTRIGVVNQGKSSFGFNFEVAVSANIFGGSSSDMTGAVKTYGTDSWGGGKYLIVKYTKSS